MQDVDLSGLKDIHIPVEPSWWPLPLGWWFVIGGSICLVAIVLYLLHLWYMSPKQYALRELKKIRHESKDIVAFAKDLSILLKRIAILKYSRKSVASLSEEYWCLFLQKKTHQLFSDEQLNLLSMASYTPKSESFSISIDSLYQTGIQAIHLLFRKD